MSLAPIVGESQLLMIMNSSDLSEFKNQLVPLWELISSSKEDYRGGLVCPAILIMGILPAPPIVITPRKIVG